MKRVVEWRPRALKDLGRCSSEMKQRVTAAVDRLASGEGDVRRLIGIDPRCFVFVSAIGEFCSDTPQTDRGMVRPVIPRCVSDAESIEPALQRSGSANHNRRTRHQSPGVVVGQGDSYEKASGRSSASACTSSRTIRVITG